MKLEDAARFLGERNDFEILTHEYPDGDTLGSAFALCLALQRIGKRARVVTTALPKDFVFLLEGIKEQEFEAQTVVSVDIADEKLLGKNREAYEGRIELCLDHHASNRVSAPLRFVDPGAASNCEIIFELFRLMDIKIDRTLANSLYTGVSTDTGCFKFGNTTSRTLRTAAVLLDCGAENARINKVMFDTKTKLKIRLEQEIYGNIHYCAGDRCAMIAATLEMQRRLGIGDDELDGLASIPRQIEGVAIGITLREKEENVFKISVRSDSRIINAAEFCAGFGGGGHIEAAGCQLEGTLDEVRETLRKAVESRL